MAKTVKDVFFNCVLNVDKFKDAIVDEIKFSKKLNSVILHASSSYDISLLEIERFENDAKKAYDLNSFKVEYRCLVKKDIIIITTDKPIFDNPKDNNKLNELLSFRSIKFVC